MQKSGHMVLKGVNWEHIDESRYIMLKSGHMVLKGVNWVHIDKIRSNGFEMSHWVHNVKNRPYSLERSQLGTH